MIKNICIVGGGTSGLVAALSLRKSYPKLKITMLESSAIGIIGVGEGSTEHWKNFMDHIDVTVPELVREAGATFKMGIKFTNWNGDGKHYFHSLAEQYGPVAKDNGLPFTWIRMVGEDWDPNDTVWSLSRASRHVEPLHEILSQYHFDTFKLNSFLHKLCSQRDIAVIDAEVEEVILDEQGYVKSLRDKTGTAHDYDFYIDCTGFRRIIGTKLGTKWVDCTSQLPMNSALAFPTEYTEDIPSYTESTALSSGWVWRIPTQERYGNGYVFCDKFIDETKAYDEVSQYYKELGITGNIQVGRKVKFGAGYVEEFWIKNCVQIGLSGIFVEPLEASSIGTSIQQVFALIPSLFFYERGNTHTADRYNSDLKEVCKNIVDFIQLHYLTKRDDSEFWKWCKNELVLTDFNKHNMEYFKEKFPNPIYFNKPMLLFSYTNYAQVMHGLGMFNNKKIHESYLQHLDHYTLWSNYAINDNNNLEGRETFSHREAINILKERFLESKHVI